jgi:hypothetical protein
MAGIKNSLVELKREKGQFSAKDPKKPGEAQGFWLGKRNGFGSEPLWFSFSALSFIRGFSRRGSFFYTIGACG